MRRRQGFWLSVVITFGVVGCSSSTEIPTVAEDPWAVPEEEEPDAGPDISTFPPCGNGGMCNPNNLGGETCQGLGMGEGILACDAVTCTYDTSMCEGMGPGMGGNGSVGVGNGNGNGNMAGAGSTPFFGGGESGGGAGSGGNSPQLFGGFFGESDGGTPFFGGSFFGGDDEPASGDGNDNGDEDDNADENNNNDGDRDSDSDQDPMDGGLGRDAGL